MKQYICEFTHTNSGGRWWITREQVKLLEHSGWDIDYGNYEDTPFIGAMKIYTSVDSTKAENLAIAEVEAVLGIDFSDRGCDTCGNPWNMRVKELTKTLEIKLKDNGYKAYSLY